MKMGMTAVQKILARASGLDNVLPGQVVEPEIDTMMAHDFSWRTTRTLWKEYGFKDIKHPDKFLVADDHWFSAPNVQAAEVLAENKKLIKTLGIKHYYEGGEGVCHQLMVEKGLVWPGALIVGMDSHATYYGGFGAFSTGIGTLDGAIGLTTGKIWLKVPETIKIVLSGKPQKSVMPRDVVQYLIEVLGEESALYKNVEFMGDYISSLPVNWRAVFTTMALELGGKSGFIAADEKTLNYLKGKVFHPFDAVTSDPDAPYCDEHRFDVSELEPRVSPPELSKSNRVSAFEGIEINQATIGGCVAGFIEDLRMVAEILKGRNVKPGVRFYILPGTRQTYIQAAEEGLVEIFLKAGAHVYPPSCGPCQAVNMGYLSDGEIQISTIPRSYAGRGGSIKSTTYMGSPLTVAASAIAGKITNPAGLMEE